VGGLLGVSDAARRLGLSVGRTRKLVEDGRIPATLIGRTWVVKEEDMQIYERKTRKPGRPLWGNWLFEDLSLDVREFLVEDCYSLKARAYEESGLARVQVAFFDRAGEPFHYIDDGGTRPLAGRWAHVCQALDHWQHAVMTMRARPIGYEVIVSSMWDRMRPPSDHLEEIARVEVGPKVGGPAVPRANL
jgi:excisionase family DNA binding protein